MIQVKHQTNDLALLKITGTNHVTSNSSEINILLGKEKIAASGIPKTKIMPLVTDLSKFSSGVSKSETMIATVSLQVIEVFSPHRYSICCGISFDPGSTGMVRNTKTFTANF